MTKPISALFPSIIISLWWTWPVLPRRPESFLVYFIQQYYYLNRIKLKCQSILRELIASPNAPLGNTLNAKLYLVEVERFSVTEW